MLPYLLLLVLCLLGSLLFPGTGISRVTVGILLWPLPGWGLQAWILGKEGEHDFLTRLAFAFVLPWGFYALLGIPLGALGGAPLPLSIIVPLIGVVLLLTATHGQRLPKISRPSPKTLWIFSIAVVLSALIWAAPPQLDLKTDVFAHVSAVRACVEEGRIYPVHEFYPASQGTGIDPRFGIVHAVLAGWCRLSRSTPLQVWHSSLVFSVFLLILGTGLLARASTSTLGGLAAVHLAFLGTFGGGFYNLLRVAGYPLALALSQLWVIFAYYFSLSSSRRTNRRAIFLVALVLTGVLGVHAFAYILGVIMLMGAWLAKSWKHRRSTLRSPGIVLLLTAPFVLLRFWSAYGDVNPIHHRPFFLMQWAPGLLSASPGYLLAWLYPFGLLALLLALFHFRTLRKEPIQLWALGMSAVALIWVSIPFLLGPSMKLLGFLPMRLLQIVLFPLFLGLAVDLAFADRRRRWPRVFAIVLLVALGASTAKRVRGLYHQTSPPMVQTAQWRGLESFSREHLDSHAVVLSDPFSMIALRATAPVSIVAVPDGRSSPRDANSVRRLRDAWRAMSPRIEGKVTDGVLERYGITHILVNHLFPRDLSSYEYPVTTADFPAQSEKFEGNPGRFHPVWTSNALTLYEVVNQRTPWVEDYLEPCLQPRATTLSPRSSLAVNDSFALVQPTLVREANGQDRQFTIHTELLWNGTAPPPDRHLIIRADRIPSAVPARLRIVEKPVRKLLETWRRTSYRFRWTQAPICPLYLLDSRTELPVSITLSLPGKMPAGRYAISLQLADLSVFTVLTPRDFLSDQDVFQGVRVGVLNFE